MQTSKITAGADYGYAPYKHATPYRVTVLEPKVAVTGGYWKRPSEEVCAAHGIDREKVASMNGVTGSGVLAVDGKGHVLVLAPKNITMPWAEQEALNTAKAEHEAALAAYRVRAAASGEVFEKEEAPRLAELLVEIGLAEANASQWGGKAKGVSVRAVCRDGSGKNEVVLSREVVLALTEMLEDVVRTAA